MSRFPVSLFIEIFPPRDFVIRRFSPNTFFHKYSHCFYKEVKIKPPNEYSISYNFDSFSNSPQKKTNNNLQTPVFLDKGLNFSPIKDEKKVEECNSSPTSPDLEIKPHSAFLFSSVPSNVELYSSSENSVSIEISPPLPFPIVSSFSNFVITPISKFLRILPVMQAKPVLDFICIKKLCIDSPNYLSEFLSFTKEILQIPAPRRKFLTEDEAFARVKTANSDYEDERIVVAYLKALHLLPHSPALNQKMVDALDNIISLPVLIDFKEFDFGWILFLDLWRIQDPEYAHNEEFYIPYDPPILMKVILKHPPFQKEKINTVNKNGKKLKNKAKRRRHH